ncbi:putative transcriptional regulator, GntR family [Methanococcus vannielii SB]|uniref:Transcriptional regulator, GntR family n=1 Tax=Methanococcus vannielii (strain ATCC 35089 / DSM 1224 / JCM 13029 / OCM 148 / SB) TaxID=406327 RepID=A6UR86_METVS|nr:PLP-dependent aminotransferase family protein [Methanococcus vannielii]ABR55008.1 putative transcriptional regulator, GntR family [Methanococcus vannielii SB]
MNVKFSNRMEKLKTSEIREILKVTQNPEVISFAGGLPAPELFPVHEIKKISSLVLDEMGPESLQYDLTEGYVPLRKQISERMNRVYKTELSEKNILIVCGSQQGLDFSGKVFIDKGDVILCESPTYLGAINAFKAYEPEFIEVPTDDFGMIPEELEKILNQRHDVKMIYVIPDFQNPTGKTWSFERRKKFMEVIEKYKIPVIEDNPYGELRFSGEILPSLKSLDNLGLVVHLGTFSKTFCPGLRVGWICASEHILEKYILIKQGADLHTSSFSQRIISKMLENYDFEERLSKLKELYKKRRDLMIFEMKKKFPKNLKYTNPDGGLFTWVELPEGFDGRKFLEECLKNNVAIVPGGSFFPNGGHENTFRLNYSNMSEEKIIEGINRLSKVLNEFEY